MGGAGQTASELGAGSSKGYTCVVKGFHTCASPMNSGSVPWTLTPTSSSLASTSSRRHAATHAAKAATCSGSSAEEGGEAPSTHALGSPAVAAAAALWVSSFQNSRKH